MNCPLCANAVADAALECPSCQEELTPWRTIEAAAAQMRRRGLTLAAKEDYWGACLALLEAALANPRDESSLVDAARALWRLGRRHDAARWLDHARRRNPSGEAAGMLQAIAGLANQQEPRSPQAGNVLAAAPDRPVRPLLGLPLLERKKKLLGRWHREDLGVWRAITAAEIQWKDKSLEHCALLEAIASDEACPSSFCYLTGLKRFSQSDLGQALVWFHKSVMQHAPVLNPAAYVLLIGLERDGPQAARVLQDCGVTSHELERVVAALRAQLRDERHETLLKRLASITI
jgi:hypothetical protein